MATAATDAARTLIHLCREGDLAALAQWLRGPDSNLSISAQSQQRIDGCIYVLLLRLAERKTYKAMELASLILYRAIQYAKPLKVEARHDVCPVACTNGEELYLNPRIWKQSFEHEEPHFPLPQTDKMKPNHLWLAFAHEWGHLTRGAKEEDADAFALDLLIGAAAHMGDLIALQHALASKFALGFYDLNQIDEFGNTPLTLAVREHHLPIIRLLLEYDANPDSPNRAGETPRSIATTQHFNDVLDVFDQYATSSPSTANVDVDNFLYYKSSPVLGKLSPTINVQCKRMIWSGDDSSV